MGARDQITLGDLPSLGRTPIVAAAVPTTGGPQTVPTLADVERELILKALAVFQDDKEAAARALGISRRTIYRRLMEYGVL
jgi:DNA-binding NtrC family response regulator